MTNRNVLTVILLSIFTCGIYSIYWWYTTTEDLNSKSSDEPLMNYILSILLSIVTCGIYGIYWLYKFYKKVDEVTGDDNCVLNLILSLLFSGIVGMAIAQNSINKVS